MDIALARQILQREVRNREDELQGLQLSLSILEDTYESEYEQLDSLRQENIDLAARNAALLNELRECREASQSSPFKEETTPEE